MRRWFFFLFLPTLAGAQPRSGIETADIRRFWAAYDRLPAATTREDSIDIFQREYIDRATPAFQRFIRLRNFTATEYVALIARYPRFWKTVRPLTENIDRRKAEIEDVLDRLAGQLPGFRRPDVCFAIGCLRTGGTTGKGLILVGSEIAAADATVDKSELGNWLKSIIGNSGDIVSMVAHEAVHTQQSGFPVLEIFSLLKHRKLRLLNMAITEGSADFITKEFLGLNINTNLHTYGAANECALVKEFREAIAEDPFNYTGWLYNGNQSKDRPADLGYFIGCQITQAYYEQAADKRTALKTLLKRGKYKKVYRRSGFAAKPCPEQEESGGGKKD